MNYYAGVGSRETPENILTIMHHVGAHLATAGWTLRSGAASGADACFEEGAVRAAGGTEIYLPWAGYNNHKSILHPQRYPFSEQEMQFAAIHHPGWHNCSPGARRLHARNTRIMLGLQPLHGENVQASRFVVAWTKGGKLTGGTAQALRIAQSMNVPIFNLGSAQNPEELETLLLKIDDIQKRLKDKVILG